MPTKATAVLLVRKHGDERFEADPRSGAEGQFQLLYAEYRRNQKHGATHPEIAEMRFYDVPSMAMKFKAAAPVIAAPAFAPRKKKF